MEEIEKTEVRLMERVLPWVLAAVGLLVYGVTLNHWVTVASLPLVAKVANWDWWSLNLQAPLFYLVTFPVRWLPLAWQPVLLNLLSAVGAAATLGLLARSVLLLPHDRTREQRQRERSEYSLLSIPAAWVPPVLAALACGFQLTFWEHATAATGEMLNLLLFAYVVRCLLEYRLDPRDGWIYRLALVYGLAVTNNWAMIAFFPPFLVALVWIQGWQFFRVNYLLKAAGCGLLGLLLYLFLPILEKFGNGANLGFWQLLTMEGALQKSVLLYFPKYIVLVCSLTSLVPVLVIGFRWPSTFGDVSVLGAALTNLMFRVVHMLFLVVCIWVTFDPAWSPRAVASGFAFLPFYYLSALSIGYFSGYFLLVFGTEPEKRRHQVSGATWALNRVLTGLVWLALVAVPAGLVYKNWPHLRSNNGPHLPRLAADLVRSLPPKGALVLSDDPIALFMVEAYLAQQGASNPHVLLDTRSLPYQLYQRHLHRRYPESWPDFLTDKTWPDPLDATTVLLMVTAVARTNATYYLHPPINYYGEGLRAEVEGLVYRVSPYDTGEITNRPPTAENIARNMAFWTEVESGWKQMPPVAWGGEAESTLSDGEFAARYYARAADYWGCEAQRAGHLAEAAKSFAIARQLNRENLVALVNQEYNKGLASGQTRPVELKPDDETALERKYRGLVPRVQTDGPFDEPRFCAKLGMALTSGQPMLIRQAAQQFLRVEALDPANLDAKIWLANLYLKWPLPEKTLEVVRQMEAEQSRFPLSMAYQLALVRLRAWAYASIPAFVAAEVTDLGKFTAQLKQHSDSVSAFLWDRLSASVRQAVTNYPTPEVKSETLQSALTQVLNAVAQGQTLYDPQRFAGVKLSAETERLLKERHPGDSEVRLNRRLLEDAFAGAIARSATTSVANLDGAVQLLREAQKKNPTVASLPETLSQIYLQAGYFSNSLAALEEQLRLDPKDPGALINKGSLCIRLGDPTNAIAPLSQVLQIEPRNDAARTDRAMAELAANQLVAAEADYEILLQSLAKPEMYRVYYGLGEIGYRRNDKGKAIKFYELYLKSLTRDGQGHVREPEQEPISNVISNRLRELKGR